jgi:glutamate synthase domain-containing protein 3
MTRGVVVVLGAVGRNFGAGMSGGSAYVLDTDGDFPAQINTELVEHEPVIDPKEADSLRALIVRHRELTGSSRAREILAGWHRYLPAFWRVAPRVRPEHSLDTRAARTRHRGAGVVDLVAAEPLWVVPS